ncbi:MAG: DUF3159 domain-containing protein [Dermabacter sp.]|nr:DUF3159 domain-containing protein [Dermabacter sp.]
MTHENQGTDAPPAAGMKAAFSGETYSVYDAVGGVRGIVESVAPTLVFVVLFLLTRDTILAAGSALGVVLVLLAARLVQRQQVAPAIGGALGVALSAVIAIISGEGIDFYVFGLITNLVWAIVLLASVMARRPLIGYVAAQVDTRVAAWRRTRGAYLTYRRATLVFAGLFVAKVAVQAPLYFQGATDALGVAKLVMGLPAFALVTFVVYLMHRAYVRSLPAEDATLASDDATEQNGARGAR